MPNFAVKYTPAEESKPAKLSFYKKDNNEFWTILIMPEEKQFEGKEGESLLSAMNSDSAKLIKELKKLKSAMAEKFVEKFEAAQQKRKKKQSADETRIAAERLLCRSFDINYNRLKNTIDFGCKVESDIVTRIKLITEDEKNELELKLIPGSTKIFLFDFSLYKERGDAAKSACQKHIDNLAIKTNPKQKPSKRSPYFHRSHPLSNYDRQDEDKKQDYGPSSKRKY